MRPAHVLGIILGMLFMMPQALLAQDLPGDAEAGRRYAVNFCTVCHAVEPGKEGTGLLAADFTAIAKLPSTTALSLRAFLQTSHTSMPNLILSRDQTDDIVAYIISLKRK